MQTFAIKGNKQHVLDLLSDLTCTTCKGHGELNDKGFADPIKGDWVDGRGEEECPDCDNGFVE